MSFFPKKTGQILLKDGAPKQFEFSKRDIVIDTNKGDIYFKDKRGTLKKVFSPAGPGEPPQSLQLGNISSSQVICTEITASGDISSSGVIIAAEFRSDGSDSIRMVDSLNVVGNISSSGTGSFTGGVSSISTGSFGYIDTVGLKVSGKVQSDLIPDVDAAHDLGSSTLRWNDLHIFSSSVRFYDNSGEIGAISFERNRGVKMKLAGGADAAETILSASGIRATGNIVSKGAVIAQTGSFSVIEGGVF
jgi:hypothetical protein